MQPFFPTCPKSHRRPRPIGLSAIRSKQGVKNASSLVLPPPKVVCMCPRSRFNQPNSKILQNRMVVVAFSIIPKTLYYITGLFLPLSAGLSGLNSCYQSIRHCTRQSFAIQARNSLPPKKNCPDSENHQKLNGYPPKRTCCFGGHRRNLGKKYSQNCRT